MTDLISKLLIFRRYILIDKVTHTKEKGSFGSEKLMSYLLNSGVLKRTLFPAIIVIIILTSISDVAIILTHV